MSITVKNLSFIYNKGTPFEKAALKDINLQIDDGEFFGIIGHTGSGKSTLIQHFNALIKPTEGQIFVDGVNIFEKNVNLRELRANIGMVFQYPEYQLFAETVQKDVAFGLKNFRKKNKKDRTPAISEEETERLVREAISLVGLDYDKIKDKSPFDLSGGQKRRVAIAGVIVTKPKVLILDEPTAGLDPKGKSEILKLIHSLKEKCCPTIIMISHDMNEIARNCTKIAVIKQGHIVCVKSPAELFSDDSLIAETGLDIPETVRLTKMLRKCGIKLEKTVFSADELTEIILKYFNGRVKEGENA